MLLRDRAAVLLLVSYVIACADRERPGLQLGSYRPDVSPPTEGNAVPVRTHPAGRAAEKELYIAAEAGYLIVLDLKSGIEVARTALGAAAFGIAVTPDQSQIWVTAPRAGKVFIVDRISRNITNTLTLGGIPRRLAFDPSGTTAVIADEAGSIRFVR